MRGIRFIILVVALGWCCLLAGCVAENDADNDADVIFEYCYYDDKKVFKCEDVDNRKDFIFSPNGDGINDFFIVKSSKSKQKVSLKIFTRAGVLVFSINAERCVWDGNSLSGKPLSNGVYFYTAEVLDSSPKISKSGYVHLFR